MLLLYLKLYIWPDWGPKQAQKCSCGKKHIWIFLANPKTEHVAISSWQAISTISVSVICCCFRMVWVAWSVANSFDNAQTHTCTSKHSVCVHTLSHLLQPVDLCLFKDALYLQLCTSDVLVVTLEAPFTKSLWMSLVYSSTRLSCVFI